MEVRLLKSEANVVRMEVMGKISRDGWPAGRDPLGDIYGKEIYSRGVMLNLSKAPYIDSTGVEWLLNCHRDFEAAGGSFVLHSANPMTIQLLKMMRMDLILNIVDDESAARALLQQKLEQKPHEHNQESAAASDQQAHAG